jgi:hypothetical protein
MAKRHIWQNGVKIGEEDLPNAPAPVPLSMNKDQFEAWFVATFGGAAKTAAEIKAAWPNG